MNDDRLAALLVDYSTGVRPGETVSLIGAPAAEPLLVVLYRRVLHAGGHPLIVMQPEACEALLCEHGNAAQLAFVDPLAAGEVEVADVAIHVLTGFSSFLPDAIDPARLAVLHRARRPLAERFLARCAERTLRWTATTCTCATAAAGASLSLPEYDRLLARAMRLDCPDPAAAWIAQGRRQARLIEHLQRVRELRIVTRAGTDLRLGVAGRRWSNGAGRENMPDGEVFAAPIEDATDGTVCFDVPAVCGRRRIENARLTFRAGRVADASAQVGEPWLLTLLDADAGARAVGEVGLGCNYAIDRPMGHPLLDEKIGGTFHLALGLALPSTGGGNRSALHCDLVGDLRWGGRIEADGQLISDGGRFVDPEWPHL